MPDRIRVLFALGSLGGGGAERQVVEILKHLDRGRFEPHLYLVRKSGEWLPEVPSDVPIIECAAIQTVPRWRIPGRMRLAVIRDLTRVLRELKPDVIYDRCYPMTLLSAPAANRAGVKRISVAVADPQAELETHSRVSLRLNRTFARRAYLTADRVVTNSERLGRRMIDYFALPEQLVTHVPNMIDVARIDRLASEPSGDLERGCFHVVTTGRLHPDKGYRYLIEAARELVHVRGQDRVRIHIFGQGPQETELRQLIEAARLKEHVILEGFAPNPLPMVRQADLFCLPSLHEGMPNSLLEAMVCGVPVLAANCPSGPGEILLDGKYGRLVPPANAIALADAIQDAMTHADAWKSLTTAARTHVEATYSVTASMQRLESLLVEVASPGPRSTT